MKQWQETSQIVRRLAVIRGTGEPVALATVVEIAGSSYRRPGAKLLIEAEGEMVGGVSGGCLEADVRERALQALESGMPCLRHYDTSADEDALWGLGLGCNGAIDVFVQPVTAAVLAAMERVGDRLRGDEPFAISTVLDGPNAGDLVVFPSGASAAPRAAAASPTMIERAARCLAQRESQRERLEGRDVFTEVLLPPPTLVVVGAGDDARALAALAATVGLRLCIVDHRPHFVTRDRFPDAGRLVVARYDDRAADMPVGGESYVVVMTHSLAKDRGWVGRLLKTDVPYIGLLGPRARTEEILQDVSGKRRDTRVFGPVGLDIGADGPEQVAVSIVGQVLSVLAARGGGHVRELSGELHAC